MQAPVDRDEFISYLSGSIAEPCQSIFRGDPGVWGRIEDKSSAVGFLRDLGGNKRWNSLRSGNFLLMLGGILISWSPPSLVCIVLVHSCVHNNLLDLLLFVDLWKFSQLVESEYFSAELLSSSWPCMLKTVRDLVHTLLTMSTNLNQVMVLGLTEPKMMNLSRIYF